MSYTQEVREQESRAGDGQTRELFPSSAGPVTIIKPQESDHTFILNEEFLENILLDPRVADKKVSVISVAGAYRKGKSFLLNFFLQYLRQRVHKADDASIDLFEDTWLSYESKLDGFSWRGGGDRDTNGILVWSEPFIVKDRNGEEIVILLMDTQGSFDELSTVKDCATIFAFSTMISSVQIYNVSQNIQEDNLQHLHVFTEYGKLALEDDENSKPFQSLLFLVRDWSYPYEAEYGFMGGQRILEKRLQIRDGQHAELRDLREHLGQSFDKIECFLMPHPGLEVATSPEFRGELKYISQDFQRNLRTLIPRVLDSNNIVVKSINGQPITCRELVEYFKAYTDIFHGEKLPDPKSMFFAIAEANNLAAVSSAKARYIKEMEEVCGGDTPFMSGADLEAEHARCRRDAIQLFRSTKKMGSTTLSMQYLDKLDEKLLESFESFKKTNSSKNLFKSMRTPAMLVCLLVVNYFFQEVFQFIGLDLIGSIFSFVILLSVIALSTWTYSRYSGKCREVAHKIDDAVQWGWDNFFSHFFRSSVGNTAMMMHRIHNINNTINEGESRKNR